MRVISRDRGATPISGLYNICYVNGFQAQESDADFWLKQHPTLVLRDASGNPVMDATWGEMLLDVSTDEKRAELADIVGAWIAQCAKSGFDAVELDNLDSYDRSKGLLHPSDAVAFMKLVSAKTHAHGLALAQKNAATLLSRRGEMGTDFAVVEECAGGDECRAFARSYGNRVYVIEYERADFDKGCARYPELSIVLRDVALRGSSQRGYVYDGC